MGKADAGYAEIERRFPKLESNDERNEIEARLNRLRARLHTLYQTPHT
jgi:hypothetical protein